VDDRRGRGLGGGLAVGGGTGVVGLVVYLLYALLGGQGTPSVNPALPERPGSTESTEQLEQRCNTPGALDQYTDCRLIKVYAVADDVWRDEFARRGLDYQPPRFALFSTATTTGCGPASAEVGPFYCPADQEIYFELDFLEQLQRDFGASGQFAQAYIVAHEFGHHLQTLLGTERQVRQLQQQRPSQANAYSVDMELQADCYAGVWSTLADRRGENGIALDAEDISEAVRAAEAVGDDRIQARTRGRVDPESWTHGSATQRREWFVTGQRSGDMGACDTFGV
jgi:predicted metalloprotease